MTAAMLLDQFDGVTQTGTGCWLARCPAHDDQRASLSILDDDDKPLLHDCSGRAVAEMIGAAGLELPDESPQTGAHAIEHATQRRRGRPARRVAE